MSLVSDLKKTLYDARSIAGRLGFRTHTVALVQHYAMGQHTGDVDLSSAQPIHERDGYPPKVVWLNDEQLTLAGLGNGAIDIGPITPEFPGGGTDLSALTGADLSTGDTLHLLITGPNHPNGALYRIKSVTAEKALNYKIRAVPVSQSEG